MRIYANETGEIVLSKSRLIEQFTEVFNKAMGGDEPSFNPAEDYFLNINIDLDEDNRVFIDITAETDFDQNEMMDYWEYLSIMEEFGQTPMSRADYYQEMYNQPRLVDKMTDVLKSYNPEWYFELWDACRIQAWLDNCILEA